MTKGVYLRRVGQVALTALAVLACTMVAGPAAAQKRTPAQPAQQPSTMIPSNPDDAFVALREAARKNDVDRTAALSAALVDYPIPSYIEYFRIKPQMFDSGGTARIDAPDGEIRTFLQRYKGDAIVDRMRNDWLLVLGKRRDWANFDIEYPQFVLKDDTQVECYALLSRTLKGQNVAADARALLTDPRYFGDGCVDLIGYLAQSRQITGADVAYYARLALEANLASLAARIAGTLPESRGDSNALATVVKMARNDPAQAATYLGVNTGVLSRDEQGAGWGVVGQYAAKKLMPEAVTYYKRQMELGGNDWLSDETQEWRVRAGLRQGDWKMVRQAVDLMRPGLRAKDPAWTYWYARALKADGQAAEAQRHFQALAGEYHFYGQLALEELGSRITVPARTVPSDAEVNAMRTRAGFQRAQKFYDLNLRFEGNREWNWELRGMSDRELLAAAEYARRIELLDRTVNTADRTRSEHDFGLRFLMPYEDLMKRATADVGVDMAWAYGLVRQESRFIMNARSSAGAHGLMQVMPATAKWVARKIGMADFQPSMMSDPNINIVLGTNYMSMVLTDLDSSQTLASAAYNAGPGRPKNWRSSLATPVEGAIFAETIPFTETRNYVKNVLSNATYYAALINGQPQSLKARLGVVAPSQVTATALP